VVELPATPASRPPEFSPAVTLPHDAAGTEPLPELSVGTTGAATTGGAGAGAGGAGFDLRRIAESPATVRGGRLAAVAGAGGLDAASADSGVGSGCHPSGGITCTKLPHFGQSNRTPITDGLRTTSRARHVVQVMVNSAFSTVPAAIEKKSASALLQLYDVRRQMSPQVRDSWHSGTGVRPP
jgi:hypothetical protein